MDKIRKYPKECVVVFDKIDRFTQNSSKRYSALERKRNVLYSDRLEGSITMERYEKYNTEIEDEEEINNELRKILSDDKSLKIKPSYLLNLSNNLSKIRKFANRAETPNSKIIICELRNKRKKALF